MKKASVKKAVSGNWVTSLMGAVGAAATVAVPLVQQSAASGRSLNTADWLTIGLQAASILGVGMAAKDGRVGSDPK